MDDEDHIFDNLKKCRYKTNTNTNYGSDFVPSLDPFTTVIDIGIGFDCWHWYRHWFNYCYCYRYWSVIGIGIGLSLVYIGIGFDFCHWYSRYWFCSGAFYVI